MAFVNEYISDEDLKKYRIKEVFQLLGIPAEIFQAPRLPGSRRHWTIDRERNVFIMPLSGGRREEFSNRLRFAYWWKGKVLSVGLEKGGDGSLVGKVTTRWRLLGIANIYGSRFQNEEVIHDLKDALTEYKVFGITFPVAEHTAVFEF